MCVIILIMHYTMYVYIHIHVHVRTPILCSCWVGTHKKSITLDWNEIWACDLHHCTALIKAVKNLVSSNVKGHGRVPYQKPRLKSMVHGVHPHIAECISAMHGTNSMWTEYSIYIIIHLYNYTHNAVLYHNYITTCSIYIHVHIMCIYILLLCMYMYYTCTCILCEGYYNTSLLFLCNKSIYVVNFDNSANQQSWMQLMRFMFCLLPLE